MPGVRRLAVVAAAALVALAGAAAAFTGAAQGRAETAGSYCRQTGGVVRVRVPTYGTNGPVAQWLPLGGAAAFCEWTAKDESHITVLLGTLYSTRPTLAALAYLTSPKPGKIPGGVNPASFYCSQLGGSDSFGGVNAAGGGWVAVGSTSDIAQVCVFPDGSAIDSFGIFYRTAKIVRGKNLTGVLRYHPANPPHVFG
jgi:putative hemolysin